MSQNRKEKEPENKITEYPSFYQYFTVSGAKLGPPMSRQMEDPHPLFQVLREIGRASRTKANSVRI